MPLNWVKYCFVFVCLFCILESTGISVLKFLTHKNISQTEQQQANEDENTNERAETKENRLKVLWSSDLDLPIPAVFVQEHHIIYPDERCTAHLAWVPPVPTPPPDLV
ncbi:hypothetical protein [Mucilaginibacter myungsuensis]|uniref:Uncharacterized protein n=1 Tax=Mucilaginibacter myungsuensis TaxID=649104 RepID=A0A929PYF7_9SPHI|nr:hypothetical protein [Mucilaginibacter myungsuensis]MBE9664206.1 hypothetical protein [Mucilaginibacter myungsuensis]MDN3599908.1 hypothetical protein [Mucilaginibacter myungsuensis]